MPDNEEHTQKNHEGGGNEGSALIEAAPPAAPEPGSIKRPLALKAGIAAISVIGLYFAVNMLLPRITGKQPPAPDVAGSFNGKNITVSELEAFIKLEKNPVNTLEGYRRMVTLFAIEQIIQDWAQKKGVTQREEVNHTMKDLLNDAMVNRYAGQLHEENISAASISKWEIQQYYDANMGRYQGKTFAETEDEIRQELAARKDELFFPQYIEELKKTAGLQTNFALLNYTEPDDYSLHKNETLFSIHSRRFTLGDFYQEFNELSPGNQERFAGFEAKKRLVEQMIAQELLLEESADKSAGEEDAHSMEELRIQYLSQILHREEVDDKIADPTEEEIQNYYKKNKKSFVAHAGVQLGLIWIDQGLNGEKKQEARKKADEALAALKRGTPFDEAARRYSEDYSAPDGGLIDHYLHEEQLPPELRKPAFALNSGEFSSIVDSQNAYCIIKVHDRTEPKQQTFEEVSAAIQNYLKQLKHKQLEHEMQDTVLKDAGFTIYNKTLRGLVKAVKSE